MPDENDSLAKFRMIPEPIRAFLSSDKAVVKRLEILEKNGLSGGQFLAAAKILNRIYDKESVFTDAEKVFAAEMGLAPDKAKALALDFAGYEMLPISSYLGDVESYVRSLGGNPADFPSERIILKTYRPSEVVTEVLHDHPVNVPAYLEHRLREILESRVRGVRKDEETALRLTRAEKIGGVELAPEIARELVQHLVSKANSVRVAADEPAPSVVVPPEPPKPEPVQANSKFQQPNPKAPVSLSPRPQTQSSKKGDGVTADDEKEAEEIRNNVLPGLVTPGAFDFSREAQLAAEEAVRELNSAIGQDDAERFKALALSRFRGVRDAAETRSLMMRPKNVGGLALPAPNADRAAAFIEARFKALAERRAAVSESERASYVKGEAQRAFGRDEERRRAEEEDLNRLYGSLVKRPAPHPAQSAAAAPPMPARPNPLGGFVAPKPAVAVTAADSKFQQPNPKSLPPASPAPAIAKPIGHLPPTASNLPAVRIVPGTVALSKVSPVAPPSSPSAKQPASSPKPAAPVIGSSGSAPARPSAPAPYAAPKPPASAPPVITKKPLPPLAAAPIPSARPAFQPPSASVPLSGRIQDVRASAAPRLTGPIEELLNLRIEDFRRLSSDPEEACRRIKDKLDLLEEHSYSQKIEGIKAWHNSPVGRMYLEIIMVSFSGGKTLSAIIGERLSSGANSLTEREVRAIMGLNKALKG